MTAALERTCPNCGATRRPGARHCPDCHVEFNQRGPGGAKATCPACKGSIPADASKCMHCGHQFFGPMRIVGVIVLTLAVLFVVAAMMGVI